MSALLLSFVKLHLNNKKDAVPLKIKRYCIFPKKNIGQNKSHVNHKEPEKGF